MKYRPPAERDQIALDLLTKLDAAYVLLLNVPNIVGPAYGARMCDYAAKPRRAFERLIIEAHDILSDDAWRNAGGWDWHTGEFLNPHGARNRLRERVGEAPFPEDDPRIRSSFRYGERYPVLALSEHGQLGADLKAVHATLNTAICTTGNTWGKTHDLCHRARKAQRVLLTLRSHLDSVVHKDHPGDRASLYFGGEAGQ